MDDAGPDDWMTTEQAVDAGWITADDAEELKTFVGQLEDHPDPNHPHNAALLLIRDILDPMPDTDPDVLAKRAWARAKLKLT